LRRQKIKGTIRTIEKTLHYLRIHIVEGKLTMEMRTVGRENAEGVIEPWDEIFDHFEILKR
jgi:hypothetical protein